MRKVRTKRRGNRSAALHRAIVDGAKDGAAVLVGGILPALPVKVNVYVDIAHGARSLVRAAATAVNAPTAKRVVVNALRDAAEALQNCGDTTDGHVPFHCAVTITPYRHV